MRQHKLKLPKTPGMSGLGLDLMAAGALAFPEELGEGPSMALVDPLVGQVRSHHLISSPHPSYPKLGSNTSPR